MKTLATLAIAAATVASLVSPSPAMTSVGDAVEVTIRTDDGRSLPLYPVKQRRAVRRVFAEAVKGDHYRIEVRNRLNRRVGLVIAVDGRNIISGTKSWLSNNERMYILDPYGTAEYAGWRTGRDQVNRFYFTSVDDSYAAAFKDESAMGVIAVAVYPEVVRYEEPQVLRHRAPEAAARSDAAAPPAAAAPTAKAAPKTGESLAREESAGTGYGREEYSPSITVAFEPEGAAREKSFIKYEWRETLCRKGVIPCGSRPLPRNRLWPEDNGYAPPPPRRG
jgi:hypothetical protein